MASSVCGDAVLQLCAREFRATQGAKVVCAAKPYEWYSVYLDAKNGKRAVVLANYEAKVAEFTVELDGGRSLVMATPESPEPVKCGESLNLGPYSYAMLMEV